MREIGRRIAYARKEHGGMTQAQLSEVLDVSARTVQDYERGLRVPWKHFQRLEEIFGYSIGWWLRGEEPGSSMPGRIRAELAAAGYDPDVEERRHDELMARLEELRESQRVLMSRLDQLERSPRE